MATRTATPAARILHDFQKGDTVATFDPAEDTRGITIGRAYMLESVSDLNVYFRDDDGEPRSRIGSRYQLVERAPRAEDARDLLAALEALLEKIANPSPWIGHEPFYGAGYDAGQEAAAEIAREALAKIKGEG